MNKHIHHKPDVIITNNDLMMMPAVVMVKKNVFDQSLIFVVSGKLLFADNSKNITNPPLQ